jgi:hypothetical protein
VSVDSSGEEVPGYAHSGGTDGGGEYSTEDNDSYRAVSADGARVFFTAGSRLYVRENGKTTTEVSASQRTDCNVQRKESEPAYTCTGAPEPDPVGSQTPHYRGATADGGRVFFTSCAKLTDDATAVAVTAGGEACAPGQPESGNDLYEYDLPSKELKDLTVDHSIADPYGARVLGVVGIGEDGSYVYFVAEGAMAQGAVSGNPNLYLARDRGAPVFLATLTPASEPFSQEGGDALDWRRSPAQDTVRSTPDGRHLAFVSSRSLTGYDNTDANTGEPDAEVFSYDAALGTLVCVSCNPSGARPVGRSNLDEFEVEKIALDGHVPRSYSDDGSRLFFNSRDALSPHDSNGRQDVYEYEDGHIHEISDVAGSYKSFFLDASPSGNDVFFATEDQLLREDTDFHVDVYDSRVGGGFPVAAIPTVCDNGDSCKPPVSAQPGVFGAPASATFSGAGNLVSDAVKPATKPKAKSKPKIKTCGKGHVKKRGKCVRRASGRSTGHSKKRRK